MAPVDADEMHCAVNRDANAISKALHKKFPVLRRLLRVSAIGGRGKIQHPEFSRRENRTHCLCNGI